MGCAAAKRYPGAITKVWLRELICCDCLRCKHNHAVVNCLPLSFFLLIPSQAVFKTTHFGYSLISLYQCCEISRNVFYSCPISYGIKKNNLQTTIALFNLFLTIIDSRVTPTFSENSELFW